MTDYKDLDLLCMVYNQINWPSLGFDHIIHHQPEKDEYVSPSTINLGYPSSKSQLSNAQEMAEL